MGHPVIAAIGAGGKSTTLRCLARHFQNCRVLFTTTTHIFPLNQSECRILLENPSPEQLLNELEYRGVVCTGSCAKVGKLGILPAALLEQAVSAAQVTLYEADGAHRLPLKLHRKGEPVVLPQTDRCIIVAGLSALGAPVSQVIHRYELNPDWLEQPLRPVGTAELLRCVLDAVETCGLPRSRCRVLLNQADRLENPQIGKILLDALEAEGLRACLGSVAQSSDFLPDWVLEP